MLRRNLPQVLCLGGLLLVLAANLLLMLHTKESVRSSIRGGLREEPPRPPSETDRTLVDRLSRLELAVRQLSECGAPVWGGVCTRGHRGNVGDRPHSRPQPPAPDGGAVGEGAGADGLGEGAGDTEVAVRELVRAHTCTHVCPPRIIGVHTAAEQGPEAWDCGHSLVFMPSQGRRADEREQCLWRRP